MELLDERGRIFGKVNVIDAVVVVLLLTLIAGAGLVFALGDDGQPSERSVTLDLGTQSEAVIAAIEEGDEITFEDTDDHLVITDTYVYVTNGSAGIMVQARVAGTEFPDNHRTFEFLDEPLRVGDSISLETSRYVVDGTVLDIGGDDEDLGIESTELLLETTVPSAVAVDIEAGDRFSVSDHTIVHIESVTTYPTGTPGETRVLLGTEVTLRNVNSQLLMGDAPVRVGTTIPIRTGAYDIEATVIQRGSMAPPGEVSTKTVTVELANAPPAVVDQLVPGLQEVIDEDVTAEVVDVDSSPAKVVLESEDGDIHLREHPVNKDIELTVELTVRELDSGAVTFRGEPVRIGESVTLEFGQVTPIDVTILEIE